MTRHTISLPEPIADYVEARMTDGGYMSISDYLSDLISRDIAERESAMQELRDLLENAEASGISGRSFDEIFADGRKGGAHRR